jgi:hypothetical protein
MGVFDLEMSCWRQVVVKAKSGGGSGGGSSGSGGGSSNSISKATTLTCSTHTDSVPPEKPVPATVPSARASASLASVGGSRFLLVGGLLLGRSGGDAGEEESDQDEIVPCFYMHQLEVVHDEGMGATAATSNKGSISGEKGKGD